MKSRYFLAVAMATAALTACMGEAVDMLTDVQRVEEGERGKGGPNPAAGGDTATSTDPAATGDNPSDPSNPITAAPQQEQPSGPTKPVPTNSPAGKAFYIANVHPILAA